MTVKRLFWGQLHNMGAYEDFFSSMSGQGLHLKKIGYFLLHFEEGEAREKIYRIDLAERDKKEKIRDRHINNNWDYYGGRGRYMVFGRETASKPSELYSSPEAQRESLLDSQTLITENRLASILMGIGSLALLALLLYFRIRINDGIYLSLLRELEIYALFFPLLLGGLAKRGEERNLKKAERTLDSGDFLDHRGDYSLMKGKIIILRGLQVLLIFGLVALILFKFLGEEEVNLVDIRDTDSLGVVSIRDLEEADFKRNSPSYFGRGEYLDYGNYFTRYWSLLIPRAEDLYESVFLLDQDRVEEEETSRLIASYYEARYKFISKGLEGDILKREERRFGSTLEMIEGFDADAIYAGQTEDFIQLIIRKDKELYLIKYFNGRASLEDLIERSLHKISWGD